MDGTVIEECDKEWKSSDYINKNYVPVSKIRKRKLKHLNDIISKNDNEENLS